MLSDRYFVVFYVGETPYSSILGSVKIIKKEGKFFSESEVHEYFIEQYQAQKPTVITISNWIELKKEDFEDYTAEGKVREDLKSDLVVYEKSELKANKEQDLSPKKSFWETIFSWRQ